MTRILYTSITR